MTVRGGTCSKRRHLRASTDSSCRSPRTAAVPKGVRNHLFLALGNQQKKSQEITRCFRQYARRSLDPPPGSLCERMASARRISPTVRTTGCYRSRSGLRLERRRVPVEKGGTGPAQCVKYDVRETLGAEGGSRPPTKGKGDGFIFHLYRSPSRRRPARLPLNHRH